MAAKIELRDFEPRRCDGRAPLVQRPARDGRPGGAARDLHRGGRPWMGRAGDGPKPRPKVGDPAGRRDRAGRVRGPVRAGARHRARARGAGRRSGRVGQGRCPRGRAASLRARFRGARRPPDPRRDPGHQPGGAEGRHPPRLQARGGDAPSDSPRRRSRSTTRSGAFCPRSSPVGRTGGADRRSPASRPGRRPGKGGADGGLLPLPRLLRRRGRHPHAADRGRRPGDRAALARPRDPRHRAVGCDLAVRISRRRRAPRRRLAP